MKTIGNFVFLFVILLSISSCKGLNENVDKPAKEAAGHWVDDGISFGTPPKPLAVDISTTGNPVAGSYSFGTGANIVSGNVTGTALGFIYTMTLKPKTTGVTYTINATWDGEDTFTGTMKGTENGSVVTYNIVLKRK